MDHMAFQMPGMAPPVLMNQPPQIFGAYGPGGLPQMPPDLVSHMFTDSHLLMEDTNEAKRRRIARACDMCRKKKIKCDGKLPACTHCINYKTDCVFTQVEKKRSPPKGAKYIEGLENRLGRMEHLLRLSGESTTAIPPTIACSVCIARLPGRTGLLGEDDNGATDLGELERKLAEKSRHESMTTTSNPTSPSQVPSAAEGAHWTPQSALTSPESGKESHGDDKRKPTTPPEDGQDEEEVEALSEMMCSLVTNQCGETRYIGSSSGFSIFSPRGIQWVNEKTGDDSFARMISEVSVDDHKWINWKPEVFGDLFQRPVFRPLPPKSEAMSLLKDYFENFNCMFPLFHQPTFMHLVERQYSSDPYQGSGWWASLNCALAIAHRLRVMSNLVPQEEDKKAWSYLKNAMGVFSELAMRNTDLLSVQALLGMALFMQGTPNPQPASLLVAAAIRLSHSIGLHKRGTGFNLNPIEIEQRKRVFWIAYMLDKDLCLRSGRPAAQDDDDMNVELPDSDPPDNIGNIPLSDGKGKMNLFRVMCEFTIIESNVYKRLYSTKATKQSAGELLNTIGELDQELEEWKDKIPIDFRPEHEIKASHTPLILHVVMLHFTYYNCLTTIHRMSIHHGFWTSRLSNYAIQGLNARPLNPRVFSSAALCTAAARASISLLKYVPQGDFSCVWLILYFPISALMTLFGNILQNPLDPRAQSDTRLMNLVVTFLSMLGQEAEQGGVHRMLGVCSEFVRIAKVVIEKAEKEQSARRKRKNPDAASKLTASSKAASAQTPAANSSLMETSRPGTVATSTPASTNMPNGQNAASSHPSPASRSDHDGPYGPAPGTVSSANEPSPSNASAGWPPEYQQKGDLDSFQAMAGFGGAVKPPPIAMDMGPVQQPLLPQDLFALPATLDWSWAEMSGGAYPSVENGNFDAQSEMQQ
ncbi:Transcriptional activator protein acu-15 [Tolypocladium capitatum]|uniref:Transcriptional activator protein acu-15 n=1 Tax=Tolypocladium capitatum TaxID=45235 RepID=A0A2K3QNJ9_9HYPO|nr:Transcriptional activator protein acu-15 [Tolypocladium capitatum]